MPEYSNHGDVLNRYWGRLTEERPEFQFHLVEGGEPVARARSGGTGRSTMPAGIDGAIERGFEVAGANVLCALLVAIPGAAQGRGISRLALDAMVALARQHRLEALIAPVRPSWKERYPLAPIERYAAWRRPDGLPLDPWLRVHERLGAKILKPEPESLGITGTVAEWESWIDLPLLESADYVFPHGLAPLHAELERDACSYWEPNVWMRHDVS